MISKASQLSQFHTKIRDIVDFIDVFFGNGAHNVRTYSLTCTNIFVYSYRMDATPAIRICNPPMALRETPRPTESELAILSVLWDRGAQTVRQVHEEISKEKPSGYTTTLKLLQIMREKGLVTRDETARSHVYRAAIPESKVQQSLLDTLLERAFGGSTRKLVLRALSTKKASREELAEIRKYLDEMERKQKGSGK